MEEEEIMDYSLEGVLVDLNPPPPGVIDKTCWTGKVGSDGAEGS